jgi:hypothetical protein
VLDVKIDRANANTKNLTKIPGRPPWVGQVEALPFS